MPRRRLTLAEWGPELEGQYAPSNVVPFTEAMAHGGDFLWRCEEGHEWRDVAAARRACPAWKNGDPLACPQCRGLIVEHACGHTIRHNAVGFMAADPCGPCRRAVMPRRGGLDALTDERRPIVDAKVAALLAGLPVLDGPATLVRIATSMRTYELRGAVARDLDVPDPQSIDAIVEWAGRLTASALLPPVEHALRVSAVEIAPHGAARNRVAWGPGLARYQGYAAAHATPEPEITAHLEAHLRRIPAEQLSTAEITETIWRWVHSRSGERRSQWWRMSRELLVPVATKGELWSRVDIVIDRPAGPDLVIEIDQTNKAKSRDKLSFARDAGGLPIWVRWGGGTITSPDWLPLIVLD